MAGHSLVGPCLSGLVFLVGIVLINGSYMMYNKQSRVWELVGTQLLGRLYQTLLLTDFTIFAVCVPHLALELTYNT